jgi:phenol phosphorylase subunit beta
VISKKEIYYAVDRESHSSRRMEVPLARQTVQSILDQDIIELARLGKLIEQHYGRPMDIEWAVDSDMPAGGNVFILQARPETVWSTRKPQPASSGEARSALDHIVASMLAGQRLG